MDVCPSNTFKPQRGGKRFSESLPNLQSFNTNNASHPFNLPMSLLQPRTPLRKWLRTQSVQPQLSQLILPQNTTQRQAFHASPSRSAAKQSPAAKRARTRGNIPGALGDNNVVTYHHPIQNLARVHYTTTLEEQINNFNRTGAAFWASATKEGILDPNLSLYTFMEVGRKLLETGFEKEASAVAIRKISTGELRTILLAGRQTQTYILTSWNRQTSNWSSESASSYLDSSHISTAGP